MKKYFTKEYIKECDCEEIQGLRKEFGEDDCFIGKKFADINNWHRGSLSELWRERYIWLPTGDQLDEIIWNICNEKDHHYYITLNPRDYAYPIDLRVISDTEDEIAIVTNKFNCLKNKLNPLMAKIKLIKELLNEK